VAGGISSFSGTVVGKLNPWVSNNPVDDLLCKKATLFINGFSTAGGNQPVIKITQSKHCSRAHLCCISAS
jgi:hypothetical protein